MSIFFDVPWFRKIMKARSLTKQDLIKHLEISQEVLEEIWEDIRIATPKQIGIMADILGEDSHEVARRCGFPTAPPDHAPPDHASPASSSPASVDREPQNPLEEKLGRMETKLHDIHNLLLALIERSK